MLFLQRDSQFFPPDTVFGRFNQGTFRDSCHQLPSFKPLEVSSLELGSFGMGLRCPHVSGAEGSGGGPAVGKTSPGW